MKQNFTKIGVDKQVTKQVGEKFFLIYNTQLQHWIVHVKRLFSYKMTRTKRKRAEFLYVPLQ